MKERPILFSAPMVRAILDGSKTQTRRIGKIQCPEWTELGVEHVTHATNGLEAVATYAAFPNRGTARWGICACPYGVAGDRLWVKETHWRYGRWVKNGKTKSGRQAWTFKPAAKEDTVLYVHGPKPRRTELGWHKRPSIFMPRWASRITLEITKVRVERLKDISADDAKAEGVDDAWLVAHHLSSDRVNGYCHLWDSIHGNCAWDKNPWVWVLEFKKA